MMLSAIAAINCNKTFVSIGGNSSNRKSSGGRSASSSSSDDSSSITRQVSMNSPYKADIDSQETEIDKYNVVKSVKDALIKIGPKKRNVILLRYGIVDKPIMLKNELPNNKTEKETL